MALINPSLDVSRFISEHGSKAILVRNTAKAMYWTVRAEGIIMAVRSHDWGKDPTAICWTHTFDSTSEAVAMIRLALHNQADADLG